MYTITKFRQNIRKAFNDADAGHEVVIERYGQKFQLVSLVDKPLPGHAIESNPGGMGSGFAFDNPTKPVIINTPTGTVVAGADIASVTKVVKKIAPDVRFQNGVCKIHGLPLDDRGRCMQKGCKYA